MSLSAVAWWTIASGSARSTASRTACGSSRSSSIACAPSARTRSAPAGDRAVPITSWPRSSNCGISRLPTAPLAPATKTRMTSPSVSGSCCYPKDPASPRNVTTIRSVSVSPRAFVQRSTRLQPVPGAESIRLYLADDAMALWQATREQTGDPDEPIPFWGVAWGGGLAIACYLRDHPDIVAGKRVLDLGSGSGLCAIAAAMAGAAAVTAVDIDRFAIAAIELNARANRQRIQIVAA